MTDSKNKNQTILELKDVGVFYYRKTGFFRKERFWALKKVSLSLLQGETLGIIGRNGAGKSTLLSLLAGIIAPDKGNVFSNGSHASLLSLQIGFIPHLSGRDNAILSGMLMGLDRHQIENHMDEIFSFAELEDVIDQPVKSYSTGMKARLGFAVAFQVDPQILLIDEVMGVGDAAFREKSSAALQERIKSDRSVVLVSHNPQTILDICDRAVWIEDGISRTEGNPNEVLDQYHQHLKKKLSK